MNHPDAWPHPFNPFGLKNHRRVASAVYRLGYGEDELQGVLGWIQDLAPMCTLAPGRSVCSLGSPPLPPPDLSTWRRGGAAGGDRRRSRSPEAFTSTSTTWGGSWKRTSRLGPRQEGTLQWCVVKLPLGASSRVDRAGMGLSQCLETSRIGQSVFPSRDELRNDPPQETGPLNTGI